MNFDQAPEPVQTRPRERVCLCCACQFQSAWAGERICPRCKASSVWREDLAGNTANHARYSAKNRRKGLF